MKKIKSLFGAAILFASLEANSATELGSIQYVSVQQAVSQESAYIGLIDLNSIIGVDFSLPQNKVNWGSLTFNIVDNNHVMTTPSEVSVEFLGSDVLYEGPGSKPGDPSITFIKEKIDYYAYQPEPIENNPPATADIKLTSNSNTANSGTWYMHTLQIEREEEFSYYESPGTTESSEKTKNVYLYNFLSGSTESGLYFESSTGPNDDLTLNLDDNFNGVINYEITSNEGDIFVSNFGMYISYSVSAVPEPSTLTLMIGGFGLVGLMATRRKKQAL